jgi:uncharacterized OB-fold protein
MAGGHALPSGLPRPVQGVDGLEAPYWEGTRRHELRIQRCRECATWQWGPEWLCHRCHSWAMGWEAVAPSGALYAWERVWHPTHPALRDAVPYRVALVELPQAGGARVVGTLLGDPLDDAPIGAPVEAVFEDHDADEPPYTLVQWRLVTPSGRPAPESESAPR